MWTIRRISEVFPKWIAWFFILLDFIWEAPQIIAGAFVKLIFINNGSREVETYKQGTCQIQNWPMTSGVSLGWFQFTYWNAGKDVACHEVGHSLQSLYLGWLYLPVVGLTSGIHALLYPYISLFNKDWDYYDFWCEKWANRISGAFNS